MQGQLTIKKPKKTEGSGGDTQELKVSNSKDMINELDVAIEKAIELKKKIKKEDCCGCCA